ncbi:MAG: GtrA family protein [Treponemataceae bacterium]
MKKCKKLNNILVKFNLIQFIQFGIVGLSNTFISYAIYTFLIYFNVYYLFANVIAFIISVINSFFWNNRYVFKQQEKRSFFKALLKTFLAYALTGFVLSNILLFLFVEVFIISKYIAPLLSLVITIPLNFICNKFWVFKEEKNEKN